MPLPPRPPPPPHGMAVHQRSYYGLQNIIASNSDTTLILPIPSKFGLFSQNAETLLARVFFRSGVSWSGILYFTAVGGER